MLLLTVLILAIVIPVLFVGWALNRSDSHVRDTAAADAGAATRSRVTIAAIVVVVAVASFLFREIRSPAIHQSSALFIGVPALLAIAALFSPTPRSATGVACKSVTVGLLVSLIFLREGLLCVLMSAPLFYAVAIGIGLIVDYLRRDSRSTGGTTLSCVVLLLLVPMIFEGITESTSFGRDTTVSETRIVQASSGGVERALFAPPRFERPLPWYLALGFPRPTSMRMDGDADGARWVIRMRGGEMRLNGMEPRAGDLVLDLTERRPGLIHWNARSDDSHMTHFLLWRSSQVEWQAIDAQTTRVTWTLSYRRGLDPAWYFGPWEKYAARLASGYLIDAVATP
jgi:hypothetical protein